MKKAIVTGGGGFIGSHMVDLLLKKTLKLLSLIILPEVTSTIYPNIKLIEN